MCVSSSSQADFLLLLQENGVGREGVSQLLGSLVFASTNSPPSQPPTLLQGCPMARLCSLRFPVFSLSFLSMGMGSLSEGHRLFLEFRELGCMWGTWNGTLTVLGADCHRCPFSGSREDFSLGLLILQGSGKFD